VGQQAPPEYHPARLDRFRRMEAEDDLSEDRLCDPHRLMVNRYGAAGPPGARPLSQDSLEAKRKSPPLAWPNQLRFSQRQCTVTGSADTARDPAIEQGAPEPRAQAQEEPARHARLEARARAHARCRSGQSGVRHALMVEPYALTSRRESTPQRKGFVKTPRATAGSGLSQVSDATQRSDLPLALSSKRAPHNPLLGCELDQPLIPAPV
jgi:hypothetical protein